MNCKLLALAAVAVVIASIPLSIIAASVFSVGNPLSQASVTTDPAVEKNRMVVVLLNPDCGTTGGEYEETLRGAIAYRHYLRSDFEVACAPTFAYLGLEQIESVMMPILRFLYPNDVFLFVFPDSFWLDFNDYILSHHSEGLDPGRIRLLINGEQTVGGVAVIAGGYGFVNEEYNDVRHEAFHLESCMVHPQGSDSEPETWVLPPQYADLPWCVN